MGLIAGNRVVIKFIGDDASLKKSLKELELQTKKDEKGFGKFGASAKSAFTTSGNVAKSTFGAMKTGATAVLGVLSKLAVAGAALGVVKGVVGALAQLSGGLLLIPAVIGVFGAAIATLKIGLAGFGDALKGNKQALDALAPSAKATVLAIQAMAPAWKQVQQATQQALFKNIAQDVKDLGATYLPVLHAKLPLIASDFNAMAHNALLALKAPAVKGSILEILDNTHRMLQAMPHSLSGVVTGFLTLAGAGSKYLVPIGKFIDTLSLKFAHWADGLVNSGKFDTFVKFAIQGFDNLFHAIGNVVEIAAQVGVSLAAGMELADIMDGGGKGGGPLAFFKDLTQALKDFFSEAATKDTLVALGQTLGDVAGQAQGVLLSALRNLRPVIDALAPVVRAVADALGPVLRDAMDKLGPKVADLIKAFAPWIERQLPKIVSFITDVVIPTIGRFVDWLINNKRGVELFFVAAGVVIGGVIVVTNSLGIALAGLALAFIWVGQHVGEVVQYIQKMWYGMVAAVQAGAGMILHALALIPSPFQSAFGAAGDSMDLAATKSANLARGIDGVRPKDVLVTQHGAEGATGAVQDLTRWLAALPAVKEILVNVRQNIQQSIITNPFGGFRAAGGPVAAGKSYIVGERGPEMITMGAGGHVTPNSGLGGSGGGSVTFGGDTDSAFASAFMRMVREGKIQVAL